MTENSLGIMQGRLTPAAGRGIQFFPFDSWRDEFESAKEIGLDEIEFIFDYDNYTENPLWTANGIEQIYDCVKRTGIAVRTVCFDYFMRRAFFKAKGEQEKQALLKENKEVLRTVLYSMQELGVGLIEIPLVDASSVKNEEEEKEVISFLRDMFEGEAWPEIRCGLETDLPPLKFRELLEKIGIKNVGANYDSGNSSGLGYDPCEEIKQLSDYIFNIHIKDREYHGTTKKLGTGSADFHRLFKKLKETGYQGSFIFQAARGADGKEKQNIAEQMDFLQHYLK